MMLLATLTSTSLIPSNFASSSTDAWSPSNNIPAPAPAPVAPFPIRLLLPATEAVAVAGIVHPELNSKEIASKIEVFRKEKNPVKAAQMALRMALAITSQNLKVDANTKYAEEQFDYFKKNGLPLM